MKKILTTGIAVCFGILMSMNVAAKTIAAAPPANFRSAIAHVNGTSIHYVTGGKGEALVLIHGFGQNWYMWNRLLPELSKHFTIIAPDLRGLGESGKPAGGYDKKTMATDIHELVKQLGYTHARVAGHDIGLMVAYAYAAQYPSEVDRLALMDALIPGIEPIWTEFSSKAWWWGFFSWSASGDLVKGREAQFLKSFWPVVAYVKDPFTKEETAEFIRAYAVPGATTATFKWFAAFPQDAQDNLVLSAHKLPMPVLAMGGDHHTGAVLATMVRQVADNVTEVKIADSGHWLVQEQTGQVEQALLEFFTK